MRLVPARLRRFCVREKGHLVVGGGYLITTFWGGHNSALMSAAYGTAALMATHAINRTPTVEARTKRAVKRTPKHLAQS